MINALYRGKRADNGEWVYGNIVLTEDKAYILPDIADFTYGDNGNRIRIGCFVEVNTETVGQWVTLSDRKGKKIFDGDILKYLWAKTVSGKVLCVKFCLKWSEDYHSYQCFAHGDKGYSYPDITMFDFGYNKDRFEVIGNIYDNSDLLE